MKVQIRHHTRYDYTEPVFLEPHTLWLMPRRDAHIRILSRSLDVFPQPLGVSQILGPDGSVGDAVWFSGLTGVFEIDAQTEMEIAPFNPFQFLLYPSTALRLPMVYAEPWPTLLSPYLKETRDIPVIKSVALNLAAASGHDTLTFLTRLGRFIYEEFSYEKRAQGAPYQPEETLRRKAGSCRDFVVFAMAVCRQLGLACRYVSGYYLNDAGQEPGDLHAWFEVFLPGAGWKGLDPAHGIACGHHHIALSSAAEPLVTLPVSGFFRGAASHTMTAQVSIETAR